MQTRDNNFAKERNVTRDNNFAKERNVTHDNNFAEEELTRSGRHSSSAFSSTRTYSSRKRDLLRNLYTAEVWGQSNTWDTRDIRTIGMTTTC